MVERTEGWPVGLYLAALALKAGGARETAGLPFSGDDRLMADYLRSEVLSSLSAEEVAVLDPHVGARSDERAPVRRRAREQHRRNRCWSRSRARTSCSCRSTARALVPLPPPVPRLAPRRVAPPRTGRSSRRFICARRRGTRRTAFPSWRSTTRNPPTIPSGSTGSCSNNATDAFGAGRSESVRRWLRWFETEGHIDEYPAVAVLGALFFSNTGDAAEAERWSAAAHPRLAARVGRRRGTRARRSESSPTGARSQACARFSGWLLPATGPRRCATTRASHWTA